MKTSDWQSVIDAKVLLIGENSTLQWKDEVIECAMFLDYYFDHAPYDLGERSRYSEAKTIFEYLKEISAGDCRPEQVYGTLLCHDPLYRAPRGKHILIPEKQAESGLLHIKKVLKDNPNIEYIYAMGLQTNYYLQKLGFYSSGELKEEFVKGAEPRRVGLNSYDPFYQPVNAKPFREVCFKSYDVEEFAGVKIIPILPIKSYPLSEVDMKNFGDNFNNLKSSFKKEQEKE